MVDYLRIRRWISVHTHGLQPTITSALALTCASVVAYDDLISSEPTPFESQLSTIKGGNPTLGYQKNLHHINTIITNPTPANGPYCFSSSSQFILTAARLYFLLSSFNLPDISPIRSRLSPLYSKSSMFLVMTLVTSRSSWFSLSRFCDARLSWYVFLVRCMKVSNSTKA